MSGERHAANLPTQNKLKTMLSTTEKSTDAVRLRDGGGGAGGWVLGELETKGICVTFPVPHRPKPGVSQSKHSYSPLLLTLGCIWRP